MEGVSLWEKKFNRYAVNPLLLTVIITVIINFVLAHDLMANGSVK